MSQLILPLLSAFVVGEVTLRGKENLFIFKKTPSGVGRFIKARLLHGWLIVVPVAVGVTAASLILRTQVEPIVLLTYLGLLALTVMASVTFVLGLFLLNPAFSDKSAAYMINIVVMMQGWIMLTLVPVIALAELLNLTLIQAILFVTTPLSWAVAIVMLYLGKIRLERIE